MVLECQTWETRLAQYISVLSPQTPINFSTQLVLQQIQQENETQAQRNNLELLMEMQPNILPTMQSQLCGIHNFIGKGAIKQAIRSRSRSNMPPSFVYFYINFPSLVYFNKIYLKIKYHKTEHINFVHMIATLSRQLILLLLQLPQSLYFQVPITTTKWGSPQQK